MNIISSGQFEPASDIRFQKALEHSAVTVCTQDRSLRYTWIYNPSLGRTSEDVLGRTDSELLERADEVQVLTTLKQRVLETGIEARQEISVHIGDQEHCYDLIVEPLFSESRQVDGVICTAIDISEQKQTETQLKRSLSQLQLALSALDGFIYDYDIKQNLVERTTGLTRLLGYEPDEIPPTVEGWAILAASTEWHRMQQAGMFSQGIDSYDHEYRVRHKDGHHLHIWDRAILIRDPQGNPSRLIGAMMNISERRQAEERQRYLMNLSRVLADSIENDARLQELAMLTVASVADWCVLHLIDDNAGIYPVALAHHDPEKDAVLQKLCALYAAQSTHLPGVVEVIETGDSEWHPEAADSLIHIESMQPQERQLWDELGYASMMIVPLIRQRKVIGTFTLVLSGPERYDQAADLALAELAARRIAVAIENARLYKSERIARAAAEQAAMRGVFLSETAGVLSSSLGYDDRLTSLVRITVPRFSDLCVIFLIGQDGLIHRAAAAHAEQDKEEQLIQLQQLAPIDPAGPHPAAAAIRSSSTLLNPDLTAALREVAEARNGSTPSAQSLVPREHLVVPLIAHQHIIGAISFGMQSSNRTFSPEDVATAEILANRAALMIDNARLYREKQEAVNVRDAFLMIASHELKTPLTAVVGQAQLLQQRLTPGGTTTERDARAIRVIVEQSLRLNKLIGNLLDVTRLSQGQLQISRRPLILNDLIRQVVGDFEPLLEQQTITFHEGDQQLVVDGDALRLEQVFQNLIQNALKYSSEVGEISVHLEAQAHHAMISVRDTGIGISQEALPNLFQQFYRVNNAAAKHINGFGLGLYIVHEIVTLHGGQILVQSTPGLGSTFTVTLPLLATEPASA